MPKLAPITAETTEALLAAATAVFAEQGYQQARVRDIASRAGANIAAISYHYGGKEGLYLEVLRRAASRLIERFPLQSAGVKNSPEQQLRDAVANLLRRFTGQDDSAIAPKLMLRELVSPSVGIDRLVEDIARPQFMLVSAIVARLLGPGATLDEVRRASFSLVGQCFFYLVGRPLIGQLAPQAYEPESLAALARHIAEFSLAGLRSLRMQIEERSHV